MPKLIALHNIVFASNDDIQPGHAFDATDAEWLFLKERSAARQFDSEGDTGAPVHKRPTAGDTVAQADTSGLPDVSKMKKDLLIKQAELEEVEVAADATVDQLREAILAARKAKEDLV